MDCIRTDAPSIENRHNWRPCQFNQPFLHTNYFPNDWLEGPTRPSHSSYLCHPEWTCYDHPVPQTNDGLPPTTVQRPTNRSNKQHALSPPRTCRNHAINPVQTYNCPSTLTFSNWNYSESSWPPHLQPLNDQRPDYPTTTVSFEYNRPPTRIFNPYIFRQTVRTSPTISTTGRRIHPNRQQLVHWNSS